MSLRFGGNSPAKVTITVQQVIGDRLVSIERDLDIRVWHQSREGEADRIIKEGLAVLEGQCIAGPKGPLP